MDQDLGTLSTTLTNESSMAYSMWTNAPVRIYVGGGEGTIVKDLEVVVTGVPLTIFDIEVADSMPSGGAIITWDGAAGQVYELQYTTDLSNPSWTTDPTVGDIYDVGGTMSVTSTVGVANAFYRFILK